MKSTTTLIGEKDTLRGHDRVTLNEYAGDSKSLKGLVMFGVHVNQGSLTVHCVTPAQLRDLAASCISMAEALEPSIVEPVNA